MEQNLKWPGLIFNFPWKATEDQLIELLSAEWWLVAGVLQRILVKVSPPHSAGHRRTLVTVMTDRTFFSQNNFKVKLSLPITSERLVYNGQAVAGG